MSAHLAIYLPLSVIAAFAIATYLRVANSPAYRQKPEEVVTREPGDRILGAPKPISSEAHEDLDFALLSQAAYQRKVDSKSVQAGACVDADAILKTMGWERWENFPNADLQERIDKFHLRVEVWSNPSRSAVAVAFGGTVFTNIKDWYANLRWFFPHRQDEYTVVVKVFGKMFVDDYKRREGLPAESFLRHASIFSTGHSLGGGLAQEFAYSLPRDADVPRVKKVYAFDPTPVTGFFSVGKDLRTANARNLKIDRIYERGEILAYFRSLTNFFAPPSASSPTIRQVRYNVFHALNPFAGHSIAELACKLHEVPR